MKALISIIEHSQQGYRVAQVEHNTFAVSEDLFWVECADDVVADQFWYDPSSKQIKPIPTVPVIAGENQPIVNGAETL
jgi:hypothetical protein